MKNTTTSSSVETEKEDMPAEYDFDYSKAKPNRFAERLKGTRTIILDPDVAVVFTTAEAVNDVLRALLATMPNRS